MEKITVTTNSAEETMALAEQIGARLHAGDVIAYSADWASERPPLPGVWRKAWGCPMWCPPHIRHCAGVPRDGLSLYHFDMYRIDGAMDLESTGFYDYPLDEGVFAIEWSENIRSELPADCIRITIQRTAEEQRKITIEGDERFADLGN